MNIRASLSSTFAQILGLVLLSVIAGQMVALAVAISAPPAQVRFTLEDAVSALRTGEPLERDGSVLRVVFGESPPPAWDRDPGPIEPLMRAELARRFAVDREDVLVEQSEPFPGAKRLMWRNHPAPPPEASDEPFPLEFPFDDYKAAVRNPSGTWAIVSPPEPFLSRVERLMLLWLGLTITILVPLVWLFHRRLVRPIRALARAAARAQGNADVPPLSIAGPHEVRTATAAFNEMQQRIREYVEERMQLVASIAHDLRTPLMRLRFRAEGLAAEERNVVVREIDHMDRMIGACLAFVRGAQRSDRDSVDLGAALQSVVDDLSEIGANIRMEPGPEAEILADPVALRRLFINVLENATKYGERATCRIREADAAFFVEVDDVGEGLSKSDLERVFEPFYRGATALHLRGSGLGLATARSIAAAHGGQIRMLNLDTGGVRVEIRLPKIPG